MGQVTKVYQTESAFIAEMLVSGFRVTMAVSTAYLASGGSLFAAKNDWVRQMLKANGEVVDAAVLRQTAKLAAAEIRKKAESYFVGLI